MEDKAEKLQWIESLGSLESLRRIPRLLGFLVIASALAIWSFTISKRILKYFRYLDRKTLL
jgi:hypothetical protein